uniref:Uncharacterized protein n=1 Tax=Branchiostoma floridae TaxID=7739 RepID=C3ZII8_BRAFL|eukprot:XP_002591702.1 hypothetical protein BRAFLDRAFT_80802 [Branchiostoma floridae]
MEVGGWAQGCINTSMELGPWSWLHGGVFAGLEYGSEEGSSSCSGYSTVWSPMSSLRGGGTSVRGAGSMEVGGWAQGCINTSMELGPWSWLHGGISTTPIVLLDMADACGLSVTLQ